MGSSAEEKSWAASHGGSMNAVADEARNNASLERFFRTYEKRGKGRVMVELDTDASIANGSHLLL